MTLQKEVADAGIRVQSLCPGYTRSEFHDRDAMSAFDRGMVPDDDWMDAPSVVSASLAALDSGPVVLIPGEGNRESARKGIARALSKLEPQQA